MKWSLFIGKPFGIRLYIHWTFLILLIWISLNSVRAGADFFQASLSVLFMLCVFSCVLLHEMGHALAGKKFGYATKRITLLPIGGVASMDDIPTNPRHELLVTIAGPAVNLILALLFSPVFLTEKKFSFDYLHLNSGRDFLANLFLVNITLLIFNLIPAFPMDGGRILRSVLTLQLKNRVKATGIASGVGKVFSVVFFVTGIFFNPFLAVIGVVVFLMAHTENEMVRSGNLLSSFSVADVMMKNYHTLTTKNTMADAVKLLLDVQASDFVVMNGDEIAGLLSRDDIIRALSVNGNDVIVSDTMSKNFICFTPNQSLDSAYSTLLRSSAGIIPVTEGNKLLGIVDAENIREFILVQQAKQLQRNSYRIF